jgi:hypothetical protein
MTHIPPFDVFKQNVSDYADVLIGFSGVMPSISSCSDVCEDLVIIKYYAACFVI